MSEHSADDGNFDYDRHFNQDSRDQHARHKASGHFRTEWAGKFERFVDKISSWPAETWMIFGSGLLIGMLLG